MEPFYVPQDVYDHMDKVKESLKAPEEDWNARFAAYCEKYPEMKEMCIRDSLKGGKYRQNPVCDPVRGIRSGQ